MLCLFLVEGTLQWHTVSQPSAGVGNTGTFFIPSLSKRIFSLRWKTPMFSLKIHTVQ